MYQRLTHCNAKGIEVYLVSYRLSREERYKGVSYVEEIPCDPIPHQALPLEHRRFLDSLVNMFSNATTYHVSSHVFYDFTIMALLALTFAFSSASLFGFWPTFLVAFPSSLVLLSFWKTHSHNYGAGKFSISVAPSVLTYRARSPADIILHDGSTVSSQPLLRY